MMAAGHENGFKPICECFKPKKNGKEGKMEEEMRSATNFLRRKINSVVIHHNGSYFH
jgi:hypothetical protein